MHEHETKKKNELAEKEERKQMRLQKKQLKEAQTRRKKEERENRREKGKQGAVTKRKRTTSSTKVSANKRAKIQISPEEQRSLFFNSALYRLTQHDTFGSLKQHCSDLASDMKTMDVRLFEGCFDRIRTDDRSRQLLREMQEYEEYQPIPIFGDGNCLPRCGSLFMCSHEERHVEMRVRIAVELAMNDELYLDDTFLSEGTSKKRRHQFPIHMRCFLISTPWEFNCPLEIYVHSTSVKLWTS